MCDIFTHLLKEVEELSEDEEKHSQGRVREIDTSVTKITMKNKNQQVGNFTELPKYSKQQNARII